MLPGLYSRPMLLGRKVMINLDSILRSRDITLPTKVCLVKVMVFPVVMYGCESWSIKKAAAAAAAKSLQLCPTLCDRIDSSTPGSPVLGILQARTLEWVAISFSHAWKGKVKVKSLSRVSLLATPWTAAHQAPPSMEFSTQKYWSGCHCFLRGKPLKEDKWEKKAKFQETKGFQYAYSYPTELSAMMEIFYNLGCRVW